MTKLVISIIISIWLFSYSKPNIPNKIIKGYKYSIIYHIGSLALASFIIPLIFPIKIIFSIIIFIISIIIKPFIKKLNNKKI